jgi:hypothetical protein
MCATVFSGAHESFMNHIFVLKNRCDMRCQEYTAQRDGREMRDDARYLKFTMSKKGDA